MTEEEAKQKVCCGPLHGPNDSDWITCKASFCMAWRWQTGGMIFALDGTEPVFRRAPGADLHGYCGLAGKP